MKFVTCVFLFFPVHAFAQQDLAFRVALINALTFEKQAKAYYKKTNFAPIWTDSSSASAARRAALLGALKNAGFHALPERTYQLNEIVEGLKTSTSYHDLGLLEGLMTKFSEIAELVSIALNPLIFAPPLRAAR